MYLNAKKISFLGLLLAFAVVLVILGSIVETSTLFLLALGSFCVGIAIRETGIRMGAGFYFASVLLSFFFAPNKFYCITFAAMGLYLLAAEVLFYIFGRMKSISGRKKLFWISKYIVFNVMYIPMLIFFPKLVYQGDLNTGLLAGAFFGGQIVLFIYDTAHSYFQQYIWGKLRRRLGF